jgi:hypothetical protein
VLVPGLVKANVTTWSGNLGLNQAAVDGLRRANQLLRGERRAFNAAFDGARGGEDDFVGAALFKTGGEIVYLGRRGVVLHVDHSARATARPLERQRGILAEQVQALEGLVLSGRLPGDVTRIERLSCTAGAESHLEDLNFTGVGAPPSLEAWLEVSGFETQVRRGLALPADVAGPLLRVMLARTRAWQPADRCRCHELVERERVLWFAAARLREYLFQWVGPAQPSPSPASSAGTGAVMPRAVM